MVPFVFDVAEDRDRTRRDVEKTSHLHLCWSMSLLIACQSPGRVTGSYN